MLCGGSQGSPHFLRPRRTFVFFRHEGPSIFPKSMSLSHSLRSCIIVTLSVTCNWWQVFFKRCYLFLDRREGREKERKRNINLWLPLMSPLLGTWPATQACTLTGNWTEDPLVCKPVLNPLTYQPGHSLVSFKLILDTVLVFNPFGPAYLCI